MKSSERLAVLPADTTTNTPLDPHSPHNDTEAGFFARGIEEETNPSAESLHSEAFTPRRRGPSPMLITAGVVVLLAAIFILAR